MTEYQFDNTTLWAADTLHDLVDHAGTGHKAVRDSLNPLLAIGKLAESLTVVYQAYSSTDGR